MRTWSLCLSLRAFSQRLNWPLRLSRRQLLVGGLEFCAWSLGNYLRVQLGLLGLLDWSGECHGGEADKGDGESLGEKHLGC
jgi:hypothetical protein